MNRQGAKDAKKRKKEEEKKKKKKRRIRMKISKRSKSKRMYQSLWWPSQGQS
jgi:hypothetical protein